MPYGTLNVDKIVNDNGVTFAGLYGFKNKLINGFLGIDQRNAGASTAISDDVYCFDRWYVLTQTASVNVSRQTNQQNGIPFNIRLTQNQATAQRMGLAQIIESANCLDLRGSAVTLNFQVRVSTSQAVRYAILEWTGTADSVTSDVVNSWTNTTYTAGQFFISTTTTVTAVGAITPSANTWTSLSVPLSGTLGSSTNNVIVFVWTEGTAAQNFTLDIANAQFEAGSTATSFDFRPYGTELMLCQRYYEVSTSAFSNVMFSGYVVSGGNSYYANGVFKVTKRANPTVTLTSTFGSGFNNTSGTAEGISPESFYEGRSSTATVNNGFFSSTFKASAEL